MIYVLKSSRITRGQTENLAPIVIAKFTRLKLARGQCRHQRNSLGDLLLEKYNSYEDIFEYEEFGEDHYVFKISDLEGVVYEAHVWLDTEQDE